MHLTYKQSFYDYYKAYFRFLIEKCNQIKMGYILPLCAYYWEGSTFKMADLSDCKTKRNSESFLRHFFTAAICQSKCESQLSRKTNDNRNIFTLWPEFRSHCDSQFQMNTLIDSTRGDYWFKMSNPTIEADIHKMCRFMHDDSKLVHSSTTPIKMATLSLNVLLNFCQSSFEL